MTFSEIAWGAGLLFVLALCAWWLLASAGGEDGE